MGDQNHTGKYAYAFMRLTESAGEEVPELMSPRFLSYLSNVRLFELDVNGRPGRLVARSPYFEAISETTRTKLPRYLYRVSSEKSGGWSSEGNFKSASITSGLGATEFASLPYFEVCRSIFLHLRGKVEDKGMQFNSPWISFTDSWLFVKYWALQNKLLERRRHVKIHIIDTYTIENPTLTAHSWSITKAYKVGQDIPIFQYKKMIGGTYTEFLVWNEILCRSADVVDFDELLMSEINDSSDWLLFPSTPHLYDARLIKTEKKHTVKLLLPSGMRKKWYEDDAELD